MQWLQPSKTLQHLVATTGGLIGVLSQTLHLNASHTNFTTLGGKEKNLLTSIRPLSIDFALFDI